MYEEILEEGKRNTGLVYKERSIFGSLFMKNASMQSQDTEEEVGHNAGRGRKGVPYRNRFDSQ